MKKFLYIIIILWTVLTASSLFYNESLIRGGEEILLKVKPVDPRDFLRGDYVVLDYDIGATGEKQSDYKEHKVYVSLNKDSQGIGSVKEISAVKPENGLFLKGIKYGRRITYPSIQKYFVKEGAGKELEKKLAQGAYAKISVSRNGSARIKEIITIK